MAGGRRRRSRAEGGGRMCLRSRRRGRARCTARRSVDVVRLSPSAARCPFISFTSFRCRSQFARTRAHARPPQGAVMSAKPRPEPDFDARAAAVASTALRQLSNRLRRKLPTDARIQEVANALDRLALDLEQRKARRSALARRSLACQAMRPTPSCRPCAPKRCSTFSTSSSTTPSRHA